MKLRICLALFVFLVGSHAAAEIVQCYKFGKLVFTDDQSTCERDIKFISQKPVNSFSEAAGHVVANVSFDDPQGNIQDKGAISSNVKAAWADWERHISGAGSVEIQIKYVENNNGRLSGASVTTHRSAKTSKNIYFHQGVAEELISGLDPNGGAPDIIIRADKAALSRLWLDAKPMERLGSVARNKVDAVSVFAHEIGHALCFNGFIDLETQRSRDNNYLSVFDKWVVFDDVKPRYIGPSLVSAFGTSIALTYRAGVYSHFDMEGSSLRPIMAEQSIKYGKRYFVTEIDLAVIKDCGIPLKLKGNNK